MNPLAIIKLGNLVFQIVNKNPYLSYEENVEKDLLQKYPIAEGGEDHSLKNIPFKYS